MTLSSDNPSDSDATNDLPKESATTTPTSNGSASIALQHKRATRWMHWVNFPLLTIMIWSGLRIYWSDLRDPYVVGVGDYEVFQFFPVWFNEKLQLNAKLAAGMAYHFNFGWLFFLNGLAYLGYSIKSGEWRHLFPGREAYKNAGIVVLHDLGLRRNKPLPDQGKYNAAQQVSYSLIIIMGGVSILTGLAIYKPTQLSILTTILGGYQTARTLHFIATIIFILFFLIHIIQVARAGWSSFMSMVTGYDRKKIEAATPGQAAIKLASLHTKTRRSVLTGGGAALLGFIGWRWLQGQPLDQGTPQVLRAGHEQNEQLWRALNRPSHNAPTFDPSESSDMRVNGLIGLEQATDTDNWELTIYGPDGELLDTKEMTDITSFDKIEMTVEHKCVEGWSHIVTWGGIRFSDFVQQYEETLGEIPAFVNLETPDQEYYVSLDRATMMHSQTLLAYELQNEPLTSDHGAPLRLVTPLKYGTKQLKRIGSIQLSENQGKDYWTERGYDWYAHL